MAVPLCGIREKHPRREQKAMCLPARFDCAGEQRELAFAKMPSTGQQLAGYEEEAVRERQASQAGHGWEL